MQLLWSSRSPFARKVVVAARELGLFDRIALKPTEVSAFTVSPEAAAVAPLVKIPVLLREDGPPLFDSRVICAYLQSLAPAPRLVDADDFAALRREAMGDGLMDLLLAWRLERRRPPEQRNAVLVNAYGRKVRLVLDQLETEAPALAHPGFDIGRLSIGCALAYLDFRADFLASPLCHWRTSRPSLKAWFADFAARPSVAADRFSETWPLPHGRSASEINLGAPP